MTFVIMIALYNGLLSAGLTSSVAWRAAFAIVPVPFLLLVAAAVMVFGTDHPAGKWSDRHNLKAAGYEHDSELPESDQVSPDDSKDDPEKKGGQANIHVTVEPVDESSACSLPSRRAIYHAEILFQRWSPSSIMQLTSHSR